jgi:branched-chain amino acid transport system substrate-binding protein
VFRTSFGQATSMPKVARYIANNLKAKTVAVIFVNNDFGKGGRDMVTKSLTELGVKVVADISTDAGQVDFSAPVLKAKQSNADAIFVYTNEEESARALRELRKQGVTKPIVGETTLTGQKVIELAGEAANGAVAHVGLTVDAPNPLMLKFKANFYRDYKYIPDHNGIKGYISVYMMKAGIEKAGKLDRAAVTKALHGLKISAAKEPGVLLDVFIDDKGDLDRESFLVEVKNGKQEVKEVLPALNAGK